jgi:hypothetical protein
MMAKRKWMILGALVACLLLTGMAMSAASDLDLDWWVISGGGGSGVSGNTSLAGTLGQAVVGLDGSGDYDLCSGFFCNLVETTGIPLPEPTKFKAYLPAILRK